MIDAPSRYAKSSSSSSSNCSSTLFVHMLACSLDTTLARTPPPLQRSGKTVSFSDKDDIAGDDSGSLSGPLGGGDTLSSGPAVYGFASTAPGASLGRGGSSHGSIGGGGGGGGVGPLANVRTFDMGDLPSFEGDEAVLAGVPEDRSADEDTMFGRRDGASLARGRGTLEPHYAGESASGVAEVSDSFDNLDISGEVIGSRRPGTAPAASSAGRVNPVGATRESIASAPSGETGTIQERSAAKFPVGSRVEAATDGGDEWYPGTVAFVFRDGTFRIK